jgi:hypothetical protein
MEILIVNEAKVILDDKGEGAGELIIASSWGYNFSTYWGSMGRPLKEFICSIDCYYFTNRLSGPDDRPVFDGKSTMREVRKRWKDTMPWYEHQEAQKELREEFKEIERCESQEHFISAMSRLSEKFPKSLYGFDFSMEVECFVEEPWHYIQCRPSDKSLWLQRLHGDLVKTLKSQSVPQLT